MPSKYSHPPYRAFIKLTCRDDMTHSMCVIPTHICYIMTYIFNSKI